MPPSEIVPRQETLTVAGQLVTVGEMPTRRVLVAIAEIEAVLGDREAIEGLASGDTGRALAAVAGLMQRVPKRVLALARLGSDASDETLLDATPREIIALLVVVWRVNAFAELISPKALTAFTGKAPGTPLTER